MSVQENQQMNKWFVVPTRRRGASDREQGQGLVEYALILVLVAVVVIVILARVAPAIRGVLGQITCTLRTSSPLCVNSQGGQASAQLQLDGFCSLNDNSPYFQYWDGPHGYFITFTTDQGDPVTTFGPGSVLRKSGTCP
jgi:pilus assembly protein Flp/PilA